jgi:multiple sugar transport system substrate-binding protein
MKRRTLLAAGAALAMPAVARANAKPEKLIFVGDNGPWHGCLTEEVAPAFEKETGIKIDFTLLPIDALSARLKAELNSGSPDIDIIQWTATFAGWLAPHMADHAKLLADNAGKHPDFDWDDFLPPVRDLASYKGKLLGIPYRVTTSILNYQKQLLTDAGFAAPPDSWESFLAAAKAMTKPPDRYGLGIWGRQGPAMLGGYTPFLRGNGGRYFDPATFEIEVNGPKAVEALEFYGDLMTRYKVVVPDSITWEYDEIVSGGQRDRYAMTITLAPYGTLMNDPKLSQTAGRWAWAQAPGRHSVAESRVSLNGWTFGVPAAGKNTEWAFEFIQFATSKKWMRQSLERGNAPPRTSVLTDATVLDRFGWAPVMAQSLKTALLEPRDPFWPSMELQLRSGISAVLLGQKTAKAALDGVAEDWKRTLRRAGVKQG